MSLFNNYFINKIINVATKNQLILTTWTREKLRKKKKFPTRCYMDIKFCLLKKPQNVIFIIRERRKCFEDIIDNECIFSIHTSA